MGYGRMGREVEKILIQRGHTVVSRIDPAGGGDECYPQESSLKEAEGVIEFALPEGMEKNTLLYARYGLKTVIGTTGWLNRKDAVLAPFRKAPERGAACLYGSNFSIGAHLFFRLCAQGARMINKVEDYDAALCEYHHNQKADAPSGTALSAARQVLTELDRKKEILAGNPEGAIRPEQLHVASVRAGHIPGIHTLTLDSPADTLEISHNARSRGGFALGAVKAAEWLYEGRKGIFEIEDFIKDLLGPL